MKSGPPPTLEAAPWALALCWSQNHFDLRARCHKTSQHCWHQTSGPVRVQTFLGRSRTSETMASNKPMVAWLSMSMESIEVYWSKVIATIHAFFWCNHIQICPRRDSDSMQIVADIWCEPGLFKKTKILNLNIFRFDGHEVATRCSETRKSKDKSRIRKTSHEQRSIAAYLKSNLTHPFQFTEISHVTSEVAGRLWDSTATCGASCSCGGSWDQDGPRETLQFTRCINDL